MMASNVVKQYSKPTLVVGMGLTGYSIVKHLVGLNTAVCVADTRDLPPFLKQISEHFPHVEIITGGIPYERFDQFEQIVASPGIEVKVANKENIKGDIELFAQLAEAPIIAITGSNGKSTVTMLVTKMLKAAGLNIRTGGNIGTPALDLLQKSEPDFYVLELSSFQLETTSSLRPISATILNISEDHMDRYADIEDYIAAKRIVLDQARGIVVNRSDQATVRYLNEFDNAIGFALDAPHNDHDFGLVVNQDNEQILVKGGQHLVAASKLRLKGSQNIENVLSAFALIDLAGVELTPAMIDAAANYAGLPHRCQLVREIKGVQWINDSKGTNVGATVAALSGIDQPTILIAGGKGKGADFSALAKMIERKVNHSILFGEDAEVIKQSLDSNSLSTMVGSLDEAVNLAQQLANPGSVVLFSPACASFDMFQSYEHRGEIFSALVQELAV